MNDNKLAWILTIGFVALSLAGLVGLVASSPVPGAATSRTPPRSGEAKEYARLFQEHTRLQARVNFCEAQSRGDAPSYRRLCDEAEQAKLDEHRRRIAQIDVELERLRTGNAAANAGGALQDAPGSETDSADEAAE